MRENEIVLKPASQIEESNALDISAAGDTYVIPSNIDQYDNLEMDGDNIANNSESDSEYFTGRLIFKLFSTA